MRAKEWRKVHANPAPSETTNLEPLARTQSAREEVVYVERRVSYVAGQNQSTALKSKRSTLFLSST